MRNLRANTGSSSSNSKISAARTPPCAASVPQNINVPSARPALPANCSISTKGSSIAVTAATSLVYIALALRVSPAMTGLVVLCGGALALTVRGQIARAHVAGQQYSISSARMYSAISE